MVSGGRVVEVMPVAQIPDSAKRQSVEGILVPGFVDLQVNGGDGVLFNDAPTLETLRRDNLGMRIVVFANVEADDRAQIEALVDNWREMITPAVETEGLGLLHDRQQPLVQPLNRRHRFIRGARGKPDAQQHSQTSSTPVTHAHGFQGFVRAGIVLRPALVGSTAPLRTCSVPVAPGGCPGHGQVQRSGNR